MDAKNDLYRKKTIDMNILVPHETFFTPVYTESFGFFLS